MSDERAAAADDDAPERPELGAKFGMKMRRGVPYRTTNDRPADIFADGSN
jgi:hypothetical protein